MFWKKCYGRRSKPVIQGPGPWISQWMITFSTDTGAIHYYDRKKTIPRRVVCGDRVLLVSGGIERKAIDDDAKMGSINFWCHHGIERHVRRAGP